MNLRLFPAKLANGVAVAALPDPEDITITITIPMATSITMAIVITIAITTFLEASCPPYTLGIQVLPALVPPPETMIRFLRQMQMRMRISMMIWKKKLDDGDLPPQPQQSRHCL